MRSLTWEEQYNRSLSEATLTERMLEMARLGGWRGHHIRMSKNRVMGVWPKDAWGLPDWLLVHPLTGRTIWAELKRETGKPTEAQIRWLDFLSITGECYLWRPSNLPEIKSVLLDNEIGQTWIRTDCHRVPQQVQPV